MKLRAPAFEGRSSDSVNLSALGAYLRAADPESRLVALDIQLLEVSEDAHLKVREAVSGVLAKIGQGERRNIVLLKDTTPIKRGDQNLSSLIHGQLHGYSVRVVTLEDGHATLHASDTTLDMAAEATRGADLIVTIGSGTMTDVGKIAALRNGGIPHVVIQTAASVDGFTDNVSVILRNGVKRTVPSRWPTAVLADTVTIGTAPSQLNTSGFGEAISLFTAPADWYLANLAGLDSTFHPVSLELLKAAAAKPPNWAEGVSTGHPHAIAELTRLLALRGIVSGISNTTACLSGVEHVISHMLDLHHSANHLAIGLHGAQVGVGTLIATRLWRRAIDTDIIRSAKLAKPDSQRMKQRVRNEFSHLGETIADECWRDCAKKIELLEKNWGKLDDIVKNWSEHCTQFDKLVQPPDVLRPALRDSGAPDNFDDLIPSIPPELARWAVKNCHLMRNRFNLIDLFDLLGLWTDEMVDWALA